MKRYERGAVVGVVATALTVLVGLLPLQGASATSTPSPTVSSAPASSAGTPTPTPTPSPTLTRTSTPGPGLPTTAPVTAYGTPGQTTLVNVLAHATCAGHTAPPCSYASLVAPKLTVVGAPAVAGVTATVLSTGVVSIAVGSAVAPTVTATFKYTIHDHDGVSSNTITLRIGHPPVAPVIYKTIWTGHALTFDLLATAKCDDLQSPCPASSISRIILGGDRNNPYTTVSVTPAGMMTITVRSAQSPFTHARFPYVLVDKYGSSHVGYIVVSFLDFFKPTTRAIFNNPLGNARQQQSIDQALVDLINHAPKGATIEMISYTVDGQDLTNALVNAYRRGVAVRVLQSSGIVSGNVPYLQQNLGTRPWTNSFYWICHYACRSGVAGSPHSKIVAITSSGQGRNILLSASSNFSYGGSMFQWFDGLEVADSLSAYTGFDHVFQEARKDTRPVDWGTLCPAAGQSCGLSYLSGTGVAYIFTRIITSISQMAGTPPKPVTVPVLAGSADDWLERALSQVGCNASPGYGRNGRTLVRVTVRALQGARGYDIAHMLRLLAEAGCDVRVITTQPSTDAVRELQRSSARVPGGVWVGDQTWRWKYQICSTDDTSGYAINTYCWVPGLYTHMHSLAVSGNVGGKQQALIWSGSESWATDAYYNDEQVVQMSGVGVFNQFNDVFNYNWAHYTHPVGQRPQGNPPYAPVVYP